MTQQWVAAFRYRTLPIHLAGLKAARYKAKMRPDVARFLEAGLIVDRGDVSQADLHTNTRKAAERALRAVALRRKNWLFAGSDDGGERAAAIYTLLGPAKLNDLNPESYLRYVLERIANHPINKIEELQPWNLLAKMPELRVAA